VRPRPPIILYAEENRLLLQTVRDVLEFAGWYVRPIPRDRSGLPPRRQS
jgi:hypothetical protein